MALAAFHPFIKVTALSQVCVRLSDSVNAPLNNPNKGFEAAYYPVVLVSEGVRAFIHNVTHCQIHTGH